MNNSGYVGQSEPWQAAPRKNSEYFNETLAKQYTEHNIEKANQHLDQAGYADRDEDGFRLRPDGKKVSITVQMTDGQFNEALQLVKNHWKKVGVEMTPRQADRSLMTEQCVANEAQARAWFGGRGGYDALNSPGVYFPFRPLQSRYAPAWGIWQSSHGEDG